MFVWMLDFAIEILHGVQKETFRSLTLREFYSHEMKNPKYQLPGKMIFSSSSSCMRFPYLTKISNTTLVLSFSNKLLQ